MHYSVHAIKILLSKQGIREQIVDKAIKRLGWLEPKAHEVFLDPVAEKAISNPDLPAFCKQTVSISDRLMNLAEESIGEPDLTTCRSKTVPISDRCMYYSVHAIKILLAKQGIMEQIVDKAIKRDGLSPRCMK